MSTEQKLREALQLLRDEVARETTKRGEEKLRIVDAALSLPATEKASAESVGDALKLAREFNRYFKSMNGVDVPERVSVSRDEWRKLFYALEYGGAKARAEQEPVGNEVALNIIRKWPEGLDAQIEYTWRDLIGYTTNYKLHDLQAMLKKFGFTMKVYEGAAPVSQPAPSDQFRDVAQMIATDKTISVGAQLANVAFNWAQRVGHALTGDDVALLDSLRKQWDAALSERKHAPAPLPTCKCDLRTKLVGDGCAACNPERAADLSAPLPELSEALREHLLDAADEWSLYVDVDHAPMTLRKFLDAAIDAALAAKKGGA